MIHDKVVCFFCNVIEYKKEGKQVLQADNNAKNCNRFPVNFRAFPDQTLSLLKLAHICLDLPKLAQVYSNNLTFSYVAYFRFHSYCF